MPKSISNFPKSLAKELSIFPEQSSRASRSTAKLTCGGWVIYGRDARPAKAKDSTHNHLTYCRYDNNKEDGQRRLPSSSPDGPHPAGAGRRLPKAMLPLRRVASGPSVEGGGHDEGCRRSDEDDGDAE